MTPERLLAHYERIADAPDAVARLRRFVLDLAVRGKLVPQVAGDEPASELLKRIAKEKVRLAKTGEIKRDKPLPATSDPVVDFDIPSGWAAAYLGDVSVCLDYRRVPINSTEREGRIEGKVPENLFPYYGATQQQGWIDDYLFDGELVLLGEDGVPFFEPLRTKAYLITGKSWVNNHAHVFQGILTSPRFLVHYLNVFDYAGRVVGATRAKLNQAQAVVIPVALPPLAEQDRIVAKVDELMALCDRLEAARAEREATRDRVAAASLARLNAPDPDTFAEDTSFALNALPALTARPDQIKQLRQTILNLAVRGKLVAQDAGDEPASELLKRIAKEKARRVAQGTLREQKPLPPIEVSEVEFELAQGWQWVRMAEVIKLWNGFAFKSGDFQSSGVPVVRIGDLQDGVVTLSGAACVSEAVANTVGPEVWIPPDALLIAMSGATTGKTAFNRTGTPLLLNQRVGRIEVFSISVNFLRFFFETIVARNLSISFGTAIPNLSAQQINETIIPLPPLAEQHRIVAKVDELMGLCDRLEASLIATATTRRRLLDAVLAEVLAPPESNECVAAA